MNDNKTTFLQVWQAFLIYLKQPKTIWDVKDYSLGCLTIIGTLVVLTWLVVVLT